MSFYIGPEFSDLNNWNTRKKLSHLFYFTLFNSTLKVYSSMYLQFRTFIERWKIYF